eukprot:GILK01009679.1.p1 GENE.GILK01009679.1~~GILK01009679.1.p1  ORF type:complete len:1598 (+),score=462.56 GILK01009679.1:51-4796(+)
MAAATSDGFDDFVLEEHKHLTLQSPSTPESSSVNLYESPISKQGTQPAPVSKTDYSVEQLLDSFGGSTPDTVTLDLTQSPNHNRSDSDPLQKRLKNVVDAYVKSDLVIPPPVSTVTSNGLNGYVSEHGSPDASDDEEVDLGLDSDDHLNFDTVDVEADSKQKSSPKRIQAESFSGSAIDRFMSHCNAQSSDEDFDFSSSDNFLPNLKSITEQFNAESIQSKVGSPTKIQPLVAQPVLPNENVTLSQSPPSSVGSISTTSTAPLHNGSAIESNGNGSHSVTTPKVASGVRLARIVRPDQPRADSPIKSMAGSPSPAKDSPSPIKKPSVSHGPDSEIKSRARSPVRSPDLSRLVNHNTNVIHNMLKNTNNWHTPTGSTRNLDQGKASSPVMKSDSCDHEECSPKDTKKLSKDAYQALQDRLAARGHHECERHLHLEKRLQEKMEQDCTFSPKINSNIVLEDRPKDLFQYFKEVEEKRQEKLQMLKQRVDRDLGHPFSPDISVRAKQIERYDGQTVFDRLYDLSKDPRNVNTNEPSFQPRINDTPQYMHLDREGLATDNLYQQAEELRRKRKQTADLYALEKKQIQNSSKISRNSIRYAQQRLDRELTLAMAEIDDQGLGVLNYKQLGEVLRRLGFIRSTSEIEESVSTEHFTPQELERREIEQQKRNAAIREEKKQHVRVWKYLDRDNQASVSIQALSQFLHALLFSPKQLSHLAPKPESIHGRLVSTITTTTTLNMGSPEASPFNGLNGFSSPSDHNSIHPETFAVQLYSMSVSPTSAKSGSEINSPSNSDLMRILPEVAESDQNSTQSVLDSDAEKRQRQIFREFHELYLNRLSYTTFDKSIPKLVEQPPSFTPALCNKSRALAQVHEERFLKEHPSPSEDIKDKISHADWLLQRQKVVDEKVAKLKEECDSHEMKDCTFQPQIITKKSAERKASTVSSSSTVTPSTAATKHEQLFLMHKQKIAHRQQNIMLQQSEQAKSELIGVTFKPDLTLTKNKQFIKPADKPLPRGWDATVVRMKQGHADRVKENYLRERSTALNTNGRTSLKTPSTVVPVKLKTEQRSQEKLSRKAAFAQAASTKQQSVMKPSGADSRADSRARSVSPRKTDRNHTLSKANSTIGSSRPATAQHPSQQQKSPKSVLYSVRGVDSRLFVPVRQSSKEMIKHQSAGQHQELSSQLALPLPMQQFPAESTSSSPLNQYGINSVGASPSSIALSPSPIHSTSIHTEPTLIVSSSYSSLPSSSLPSPVSATSIQSKSIPSSPAFGSLTTILSRIENSKLQTVTKTKLSQSVPPAIGSGSPASSSFNQVHSSDSLASNESKSVDSPIQSPVITEPLSQSEKPNQKLVLTPSNSFRRIPNPSSVGDSQDEQNAAVEDHSIPVTAPVNRSDVLVDNEHTDEVSAKRVILFVDVNLSPTQQERIILHEGDDPRIVAKAFAGKHQLDLSMSHKLEILLATKYQEAVQNALKVQKLKELQEAEEKDEEDAESDSELEIGSTSNQSSDLSPSNLNQLSNQEVDSGLTRHRSESPSAVQDDVAQEWLANPFQVDDGPDNWPANYRRPRDDSVDFEEIERQIIQEENETF